MLPLTKRYSQNRIHQILKPLINVQIIEQKYPAGPFPEEVATFVLFRVNPTSLPISMPGHNERESEHEQVPISQLKQKVYFIV